ncbi:MAG: hypothetical protein AAF621_03565 [Pseudomonadota bacterium]
MSIGLGILSWRGEESLQNALASYMQENLFSLFNEKVIFLPEQRQQETVLAQRHGLSVHGDAKNLGILGGFKALAHAMTSDVILLLENDCPLIEDHSEAKRQISLGYNLIKNRKAEIIRLRSREHPGQDWGVNRKYRGFYPDQNSGFFEKSYKRIKRLCRPMKAAYLKGASLYEGHSEAQRFPDIVHYHDTSDYYIVGSRYMPWTNQSILIDRDFFLKNIIQIAENMQTKRRINGFKNIEIEMNSSFWREADYRIAIMKGLFTHSRIGHRGYIIPRNIA